MVASNMLSFPPVDLAPDRELAALVRDVPLVRDAVRLAEWAGVREVTERGLLAEPDVRAAADALGVDCRRLRLAWAVAVGGHLVEIDRCTAYPGSGVADHLAFWDDVVLNLLDRTQEDGLTGFGVVDEHLAEVLATLYPVRDGMPLPALVAGILQAHEVACQARPAELRRLRMTLPGELAEAVDLLAYCGLIEVRGELVRLTSPGVWALRRDLLREGHDAPSQAELVAFARCGVVELVDLMLTGEASDSAATAWLADRVPEDAARKLIKLAVSGTASQRLTAGTILDQLGPEAEPAVREALNEPLMWRHAAVWLGERGLAAPALGRADEAWGLVDTLAAVLDLGALGESVNLDGVGDDARALVPLMGQVDHPDALRVLDLLARCHPDPLTAKTARKTAMKARSRP